MKKIILLLLLTMVISACGTTNLKQENSNEATTETQEETNHIETIGIYQGQIDSNTIEVIVDEPLAIQYSEELNEQISQLVEEEEVKVTYEENEQSQLVLIKIQQENSSEATNGTIDQNKYIETTGIYKGQIDSHTIEVIADAPLAIQHSEEFNEQISHLVEEKEVKVTYEENEQGQLVLVKIEQQN